MKNTKKKFAMNQDSEIFLEKEGGKDKLLDQVDEVVEGLSGAKLAGQIYLVDINKLEAFPNQPFKEYSPERLKDFAEDISKVGILNPLLTRKVGNNLQILAGHNRWAAAKIAKLTKIPVIVLEVDDNQAILVLTSTNLRQREKLLYSEKAFAYKMQMDALKRQGGRRPNSEKSWAADFITKQTGDSRVHIHRFVRLTKLDPSLLDLLDKNKMSMVSGVALSYLHKENQQQVYHILKTYSITLSGERANILKTKAFECENKKLSLQEIQSIILKKEVTYLGKTIKINYNNIAEYLPSNITIDNAEDFIINALKSYNSKI